MHYCFISGLYNRYDALMFERQGKSLVEAGHKVSYIVCDDQQNENRDGIDIISTNYKPKNRITRFINTRNILFKQAMKVDADIYQISDPELIVLVTRFHKYNKLVTFNLREFYPTMIKRKTYIPLVLRNIMSYASDRILKYYLRKYDAVFVVTDWILNIVKNKYNVNKAVLLTNFPRVKSNFYFSYDDYNARGNVLCYEGTIYATSRQEKVFDALTQTPTVKYLLAGVLDQSYEVIKNHPYWTKVEFINGFSSEDLPVIFGRSTISNVFRDFLGEDGSWGVLKVFESMEAALPVLFSDVPLYRKINDKYRCGICVDPNDSESIKMAIEYLVNNKKEAYEMGQRGRKAVIEEFCWEKQAERYLEIINNINKEIHS